MSFFNIKDTKMKRHVKQSFHLQAVGWSYFEVLNLNVGTGVVTVG